MITHAYCNCDNQQPEEVKRGVYTCLNCHNDVLLDKEQDEPDFSECRDLVEEDSAEYEDRREEAQVMSEGGRL